MRRIWSALCTVSLLSSCGAMSPEVGRLDATLVMLPEKGPELPSFPPHVPTGTQQSNRQLAQDFLDLEFALETGRPLPRLTRFEGPIRYALRGRMAASAASDLDKLLDRLRNEAGLDLVQAQPGTRANITLNFLPKRTIQQGNPGVACFVVPGVSTYADYRRGQQRQDWASLERRETLGIFLPGDASPQEIRDCLHEEMAQALGPLNDLYRLSDSVFNDDNFHTVLTDYDMLMLRLHYAPELRNGMDKKAVAAVLPVLLARLHPQGERGGKAQTSPTPDAWETAMEAALGGEGSRSARQQAAEAALTMARDLGWADTRRAFSEFALARALLASDPAKAVDLFQESAQRYRSLPGGDIHAAHVEMQLAAYALTQGWYDMADHLAARNIPVVTRAENAALLATFHLIRAEAAERSGHAADKAALWRSEGLRWARYGFGSGRDLEKRLNAIAALARPLAPPKDRG